MLSFLPQAPFVKFKLKGKTQIAQVWAVEKGKLFVNWCGNPMEVAPVDFRPRVVTAAQLDILAEVDSIGTGIVSTADHYLLELGEYLTIGQGHLRYCKLTDKGRAYLAKHPTSSRSSGSMRVKGGSHNALDRNSSRGTAPRRPSRVAVPKASGAPLAPESGQQPPARALQVGAPTPRRRGAPGPLPPDGHTSPRPGTRQPGSSTLPAPEQGGSRSRAPSKPKPDRLQVTPNAVRVVLGAKATYYPLSAFETLKHGDKTRVRTKNQLYRSYPLAASEADDCVPG